MNKLTTILVFLLGSGIYYKLSKYILSVLAFESHQVNTKVSYAVFLIYILLVVPGLFMCSQKLKIETLKQVTMGYLFFVMI